MNGRQETHAVVKAPRQDAGYMKLASENMKTASLEEGFQGRDEMWQAKEDLLFEDLGALSLSTSMISIAARTEGKGRNNNATTGLEGQTRTKNIKHIEGILDNLSSQRYISLPFPTQEDYPGATSATNSNNVRQILAPPSRLRCYSRSSFKLTVIKQKGQFRISELQTKFSFYVPYSELQHLQKLGKGAAGTVWLAKWRGSLVTIKQVPFLFLQMNLESYSRIHS
jgi:hypothetical protein